MKPTRGNEDPLPTGSLDLECADVDVNDVVDIDVVEASWLPARRGGHGKELIVQVARTRAHLRRGREVARQRLQEELRHELRAELQKLEIDAYTHDP